MRAIWVFGLIVLLGGCSTAKEQAQGLLDLVVGEEEEEEQVVRQERPLYCYRTIGSVECYTDPLPKSELGRLVEYYGPPPASLRNGGAPRP